MILSPELITAFGTVVLAVFSINLAWYTAALCKEQIRQRQPEVIVSIEPDKQSPIVLNFVVDNIGRGGAYGVQISVEKDTVVEWGSKSLRLSELPFLDQPYIKPYAGFYKRLGMFCGFKEKEVQFFVSYRDKYGKKYTESFRYNLEKFSGMAASDPTDTIIANHLDKINQNLGSIAGKRIKVDIFDSKNRHEEHLEVQKRQAELKASKEKVTS